jgi:hypothetical protein
MLFSRPARHHTRYSVTFIVQQLLIADAYPSLQFLLGPCEVEPLDLEPPRPHPPSPSLTQSLAANGSADAENRSTQHEAKEVGDVGRVHVVCVCRSIHSLTVFPHCHTHMINRLR